MSEDNWKKLEEMMDSKLGIVKKDLELALKELKIQNLEPLTPKDGSGKVEGHKTLEEQLECPDCYQKIRKAVIKKEFAGADHQCLDCGLPVRGEESEKDAWSCPSCSGKFAKPRK